MNSKKQAFSKKPQKISTNKNSNGNPVVAFEMGACLLTMMF